jgi:hypothetical protein
LLTGFSQLVLLNACDPHYSKTHPSGENHHDPCTAIRHRPLSLFTCIAMLLAGAVGANGAVWLNAQVHLYHQPDLVVEDFNDMQLWDEPPAGYYVEVGGDFNDGASDFAVDAYAGFNNGGFGQVKQYLRMDGARGGDMESTWGDSGSADSLYIQEMQIQAPSPDFWDGYYDGTRQYSIQATYSVSGRLEKSADAALDMRVYSYGYFDYSEMTLVEQYYGDGEALAMDYAETLVADINLNDLGNSVGLEPGSFALSLGVQFSMHALGEDEWSGLADFWGTGAADQISLFTQDEGGEPVLVVTFDGAGDFVEGD